MVGTDVDFSGFPIGKAVYNMPPETRSRFLFGPPPRAAEVQTSSAADQFSTDMRGDSFVRQYEGKNTHIRSVLIHKILDDDCYAFKVLLPIQPLPDGKELRVSILKFNDHALDEVPETGTVRVTTSKFIEWRSGLTRRGLGFHMEDGFAMTAPGVLSYFMSIQQITNATTDAMSLEVFSAIMGSQPAGQERLAFYNPTSLQFMNSTERIIQYRMSLFGLLTKSPSGLNQLIHVTHEVFKKRSVEADTMILPNGTRHVMAMQTTQQTFAVTGMRLDSNYSSTREYVYTVSGIDIFESPLITMGDGNGGTGAIKDDVLLHHTQQGDVYRLPFKQVLQNALSAPKLWRASMQSTSIYSNEDDRFMTLTMKDMLPKMGIWGPNGTMLRPIGEALFISSDPNIGSFIGKSEGGQMVRDMARFIVDAEIKNFDTDVATSFPANTKAQRAADAPTYTQGRRRPRSSNAAGGMLTMNASSSSSDDDDTDPIERYAARPRQSPYVSTESLTLYDSPETKDMDEAGFKSLKAMSSDPAAQLVSTWGTGTPPSRDQLLEFHSVLSESKVVAPAVLEAARRILRSKDAQIMVYAQFAVGDTIDAKTPHDILAIVFRGKPKFAGYPTTGSLHLTRVKEGVVSNRNADRYPDLNNRIPGYYLSMSELIPRFLKESKAGAAAGADDGHIANMDNFEKLAKAMDMYLHNPRVVASARVDTLNQIVARLAAPGSEKGAYQLFKAAAGRHAAFQPEGDSKELADKVAEAYKNMDKDAPAVEDTPTGKVINALFKIPLTLKGFQFLLERNIPAPLGVRIMRPYVEWLTGTAIVMKKGLQTGFTAFGNGDFQLGNDTHRKVLHGNFTCEMGVLVMRPENIILLPDVLIKEYANRGGGVRPFDLNDPQSTAAHDGTSVIDNDAMQPGAGPKYSTFFVPLLPNEEDLRNITDMTGYLCGEDPKSRDYTVARAFCDAWNISHRPDYFGNGSTFVQQQPNTLLVQGVQTFPCFDGGAIKMHGVKRQYDGWWTDAHTFDGCLANRCGRKGGLPGTSIPVSISSR